MRRILFTLCLFVMLPLAIFAQTLQDGSIIAITYTSDSTTYYLQAPQTTGNVSRVTTPNERCLWRVSISGSDYTLRNVVTGNYLSFSNVSDGENITAAANATNWRYNSTNGRFYYYSSRWTKYYLCCPSKTWVIRRTSISNYGTAKVFNQNSTKTYTGYHATITPSYEEIGDTGENIQYTSTLLRDFTTTPTYTSGSISFNGAAVAGSEEIRNVNPTYSIPTADNSWATINASTGLATFLANPSTTQRTTTVTVTYNVSGANYTATANVQQDAVYVDPSDQPNAITFSHKAGASGRELDKDNRQGVHTYYATVYMAQGESKVLALPENDFRGYCRWYNYATDGNIKLSGLSSNNYTYTTAGYIRIGTNQTNAKADNATYLMNGAKKIACDISNYIDYAGTPTSAAFTEPTLSYRAIFDIRPASEVSNIMQSCTDSSKVYETHKLVIPSGKNINLSLDNTWDNYYYGNYDAASMTTANNWQLKNSSLTDITATKQNNRIFCIAAPSVGDHTYYVTYTANGTTYYVARYDITVVDAANTIFTTEQALRAKGYDQTTLQKTYQYDPANGIPATQDFNSYDGSTPLEWDECSYGFSTYNTLRNYRKSGGGTAGVENGQSGTYAYWGEYALLTSASGFGNPTLGTPNGTFLYIDAASAPGTVANLKINGELCRGAKMLFTARIADLNNNGDNTITTSTTRPNLNFVITGVQKGTNGDADVETPITTFTTGDVTKGGTWYQYVFELTKNDNIDYDEYRLKIVNNGNSTAGNDFAIDDIQIWKGKAPVLPYQGKVQCNNTSGKIASVVRVNYNNTVASNTDYFYQWRTVDGTAIDLNYLNRSLAGKDQTPNYGLIQHSLFLAPSTTIKTDGTAGSLFPSITDLLSAAENAANATNATNATTDCFYGYIQEDVNGTNAYVLYVIHVTDKMEKGNTYVVEIAEKSGPTPIWSTGSTENTCGMQGAIKVNVPQALRIDSEVTYNNENGNLCAQQIHTLEPILKINVMDNNANDIYEVEGLVTADWLKFKLTEIPSKYTFTANDIQAAIEHLRTEFRTINNIKSASAQGSLTATDLVVLQTLVADNNLILYENNHNEYLNPGEKVNFTIFPIEGTVTAKDGVSPLTDKYGNELEDGSICLGQMEASISAKNVQTGTLKFGKNDSDYPENKVATTRLYTNDIATNGIFMGIRKMDNVRITEINLIPDFTTDPDIISAGQKLVLMSEAESANFNETVGLTIPANKLSGIKFKEGYQYAIEASFDILSGGDVNCQHGTNYFLVKITPYYVQWAPMGGNTAWNNDANWITIGADGKEIHNAGFIPGNETNVIIAKDAKGVYPILPTASNGKENGYQKDVEWDYNFANATAQDIYFKVGTMMGNQQTLDYNDAYVDMALPSTRWTLAGMPMQSMVSGDFNVPTSEMDGHAPFTVTNYDGNYTVQFWQNLYYNTTAYNVGWSGVDNATNVTLLENTNWTSNFNGVKQLYTPGTAAAVWPVDDRKNDADNYDVVVSLPGKETPLYYYSYGNPTGIGESIDRTNNTKLAYPQTTYTLNSQANDEYVVFGNPTMAYIDLNSFIARNTELDNEYTYWYGNVNTLDWTSYTNNGSANATALPSEIVEGYLAPMRGIMLKKADRTATTVTITIDPTDLTTTPTAAPATPTASSLFITAKCADHISHASVVEGSDADNGYNANEDAKAIRIDNDFTPSVLYTVGGEKALSINSLSNINNVPVAVLTEQTTSATLSFEGADSFNGKLYLHDAQANTSTLITNEDKITITTTRSGEPIRYFIQKVADETTAADVTTNDGINIFVQPDGSITVASNDMLTEVNVYNGAGQRILHQTANDQFVGLSLPAGVYAIQAVSTNESKTQKVVVK